VPPRALDSNSDISNYRNFSIRTTGNHWMLGS